MDDVIRAVIVGDDGCGKTCLLMTYTKGTFPMEHIPMVFDSCTANVNIDGRTFSLCLQDTGMQTDYRRLRRTGSYGETNIVLICFPIDSPTAFQNIMTKWRQEMDQHYPNIALLLVGTKADVRNNNEEGYVLVTKEQGSSMALELGAVGYVECSALNKEGLNEVFEEAIRGAATQRPPRQQSKSCGSCEVQ